MQRTNEGHPMPRRRVKTRVELLANALEAAERASADLEAIDLRTTSGELRALLQAARQGAGGLTATLTEALREDLPTPVSRRVRQRV